MLLKPIVAHGNARAVIIPRNLLSLLGVDPNTGVLQLSFENERLIVQRAPMSQQELEQEKARRKAFFQVAIDAGEKL